MGYNGLVSLLRQLVFEILEQKREYKHGLLGDGIGNVAVVGRDDYVYVRENKNSSKIFQILNKRVTGEDGTPILYGELPWQPGVIQVVSIDWAAYSLAGGWGGDNYNGVAAHHRQHQYPSEADKASDAVLIYQPALQMLKTVVDSGFIVSVNRLIYYNNSVQKEFSGASVDLSASVPPSGHKRYVLLSFDIIAGSIKITEGTSVIDAGAIPAQKPECATDNIPSAYILLSGGATSISATDIEDARAFLGQQQTFTSYLVTDSGLLVTDESAQFVVR